MIGEDWHRPGGSGPGPEELRPSADGSADRRASADGSGDPRSSEPALLVLHAVRLLGVAEPAAVAARFGLPADEVAERLLDAEALGWVSHSRFAGVGGWSLTERGRAEGERLLADELGPIRPVVERAHEEFLPLNARFLAAVSRWQLRPAPGDPLAANDHTDHRWDDRVLDELRTLVGRARQPCAALAGALERFGGYHRRLAAAQSRADSGQRSAVDGLRGDPTGESLHTVWFELHEDLIATLGIGR